MTGNWSIPYFIVVWNSVQFCWTSEERTSLWLFKSPHRTHYVAKCLRHSVSCFQKSKRKDVFFTGPTDVDCRTLSGNSFLFNLPKLVSSFSCAKEAYSISFGGTFSATAWIAHGVATNARKSQCMHRWKRCAFPTIRITSFFIFFFQCNLFFLQTEHTSGVGDFRSFYISFKNIFQNFRLNLMQTGNGNWCRNMWSAIFGTECVVACLESVCCPVNCR
jgi:hypothetical protein